jgi:hypothetical protein
MTTARFHRLSGSNYSFGLLASAGDFEPVTTRVDNYVAHYALWLRVSRAVEFSQSGLKCESLPTVLHAA